MSLSKVRRVDDNNYRRDSFDDKVCDDLSEVILQYLSLEDKFRFECVSKQFQRTVFRGEVWLHLSDFKNVKRLEVLLKKLPAIKEITTFSTAEDMSPQLLNETMDLIIKYCNHLTRFDTDFLEFSEKDIQMKFFEKFGHKLVSIDFDVDTQYKCCLNQMPNIEELNDNSFTEDFPDIEFKRLKRFTIDLNLDMDLTQFNVFIERNSKTITHLTIDCESASDYLNEEEIEVGFGKILTIVPILKNLVHLKIDSDLPLNHNSFTKQLSQIAMNCNQLKSLSFSYELDLTDGPNSDQFLPLKQFKRLKRLELKFVNKSKELSDYLSDNQFFPFKSLSKLVPHLTHISFDFGDGLIASQQLSDTIFTDIDINFPKLQSLTIIGEEVNVSEQTVLMMSRMTRLVSIQLYLVQKESITQISSQLAKNCKKLRKIKIY